MTDAPLTSSWCTNWAGFNTPRLWAMVSEEDNPDAWRQVQAWAQVAGAVEDHRSQLVRAREALTAAWPPETNKSADAFVNELDKLIKGMGTAREDADTTATGLANILEALRQAKDKIQPLYEEYRQKNDDWVPGWWDNAEDEIDRKAQAHMIAAEQIVEQNVPQLRVPEPYVMDPAAKSAYVPDRTDPADGSSGSRSGDGSGVGRVDAAIPVPHDPVPPLPGHQSIVPSPADVGAVSPGGIGLAGSAPPAVLPPGPGTAPPVIGGPAPAPAPEPMPGLLPGIGGPLPGGGPQPGGGAGRIPGGGSSGPISGGGAGRIPGGGSSGPIPGGASRIPGGSSSGPIPGGSAGGPIPGGSAGGPIPGGNARGPVAGGDGRGALPPGDVGGRGPTGSAGNPGTIPAGAGGGYAGRPAPRGSTGGTRGTLPSGAVIGESVAGRTSGSGALRAGPAAPGATRAAASTPITSGVWPPEWTR